MAFGFSQKHVQDFKVDEITPRHSFAIAIEVAKRLNWDISFLSESGFIAYTKFSMSSWSEEIQFKIDLKNININSECIGLQIFDWGKNKKNIKRFIKTYESIKENFHPEELDNKFAEIEETFVAEDEDVIGQPHLSKKRQSSGILSIFQARKGYSVTPSLLGLNLFVFIFMVMLGVDVFLPDVKSLVEWGANYKPETLDNEWWRLISSCFIHIGIFHFFVNMYALVYIGLLLEPYLGKARFFSAYILSGIAGSVTSLYWNELTVSAGASGAIFGMFGVFLAMLTTNLIEKSARRAILPSISVFVGYNLLNGLQYEGIDNAAHIGGLISGIVFGYAFYPSLAKPKNVARKTLTITLITALVLYPSFLVLTTSSSEVKIYESRMKKFGALEEKALGIYNRTYEISDEQILDEIEINGIQNWKESIVLLKGTDTLDIPERLHNRNLKLIEYCELRIKSYEIIYKSVSEKSDKYKTQIEQINVQIEEKLDEMSE